MPPNCQHESGFSNILRLGNAKSYLIMETNKKKPTKIYLTQAQLDFLNTISGGSNISHIVRIIIDEHKKRHGIKKVTQ